MNDKSQLSVLNRPKVRVDAEQKVRGTYLYPTDLPLFPGTLHCKILRSTRAHARVKSIDTGRAKALEGVVAVITHEDVCERFISRGISPHPSKPRPWDSYLLEKEVRYVGDRVAAVAAVSAEVAEQALELIEVEYEDLPAVFDPVDAYAPGAPKVHEFNFIPGEKGLVKLPIERNVVAPVILAFGDVQTGFEEADFVVEDDFRTAYQFQHPMGRPACLVKPTDDGGIEVWNPSQGMHWSRMNFAPSLGLPLSKVKIHRVGLGGAFGIYIYQRFAELICAFLAMKTGQPMYYEEPREELVTDGGRHPAVMNLKIGVKKDGSFTAMEMRVLDGVGAYSSGTATLKLQCGFFMSLYRCPNKRFEGRTIYMNTPPLGSMRGAGNPEMTFAVEQQVDRIAEKLGMDPLELRLKNRIREGDIYYGQGPDVYCTIKTCGTEELVRKGAEVMGWRDRGPSTPYPDRPWIRRAIGMAIGHHTSGTSSAESKQPSSFIIDYSGAIIKMNEDGIASVLTPTSEAGTGALMVDASFAAEAIGLRYEDVKIVDADSDIALWDHGTMASRHTYTMGNALRDAGLKVRAQILEWAAALMSRPAEELEVRDSRVFVKSDPAVSVSVAEALQHAQSKSWGTASAVSSVTSPSCPPHFVVTFVEVEVDTQTGEVRATRAFHSADVGTPINPDAVRGQLMGGLHMGLGYSLSETLAYDAKDGHVINPNFVDYKEFTAVDMPKTVTALADTWEPDGPFGAKGIGEGAMNPVPAAVFNAVTRAIGVRVPSSPITPEKVLRALRQKG